ncbi:uncharacterized protein MONOS_18309 [Monocercomonoides exilis]|uniref:uncharacterized protein n=1 Tax=Monocercomonoides exilis TaxID=2049356 RepID=UPI00355AAF79|nr:hypothetical protein MONOS_18309 [Monocercomonoides exilis]
MNVLQDRIDEIEECCQKEMSSSFSKEAFQQLHQLDEEFKGKLSSGEHKFIKEYRELKLFSDYLDEPSAKIQAISSLLEREEEINQIYCRSMGIEEKKEVLDDPEILSILQHHKVIEKADNDHALLLDAQQDLTAKVQNLLNYHSLISELFTKKINSINDELDGIEEKLQQKQNYDPHS